VILAEDEAGLYLQATTTAVWAPQGETPVIPVHAGREKADFYGTLNLHTGEEIVMRAATKNSITTALHLEQVLAAVPGVPILMLWDRAPWHRGDPIRKVLKANSRLEIMQLPVATPELNPQEHVWKAARTAVSHNHVTRRLPHLANRFEMHLRTNRFKSSFLDRYRLDAICAMFN